MTQPLSEQARQELVDKAQTVSITSDTAFELLMERNPDIMRRLLELILGSRIQKLDQITSECRLVNSIRGKQIGLDVMARDNKNRYYDLEMQNRKVRGGALGLLQRALLYYSSVVCNVMYRGMPHTQTPKVAVLFLCNFDPVGDGDCIYHLQLGKAGLIINNKIVIVKKWGKLRLIVKAAGQTFCFVNIRGNHEELQPELRDVLEFMHNPTDERQKTGLAARMAEAFQEMKEDKMFVHRYIAEEIRRQSLLAEGRKEGRRQEGRQKVGRKV